MLNFKVPGGTSRGVLKQKETYFLKIKKGNKLGIGECALFRGLSYDNASEYEPTLQWLCDHINEDPRVFIGRIKGISFHTIWIGTGPVKREFQ